VSLNLSEVCADSILASRTAPGNTLPLPSCDPIVSNKTDNDQTQLSPTHDQTLGHLDVASQVKRPLAALRLPAARRTSMARSWEAVAPASKTKTPMDEYGKDDPMFMYTHLNDPDTVSEAGTGNKVRASSCVRMSLD
jgi:hypothetical protein